MNISNSLFDRVFPTHLTVIPPLNFLDPGSYIDEDVDAGKSKFYGQ